jgi:ABC-type glycerol-3-phosphate transport system substrate-binding protein
MKRKAMTFGDLVVVLFLLAALVLSIIAAAQPGPCPETTCQPITETVWKFDAPTGRHENDSFDAAIRKFNDEHRDCEIISLARGPERNGKVMWKVVVKKK